MVTQHGTGDLDRDLRPLSDYPVSCALGCGALFLALCIVGCALALVASI